MWTNKIMQNLSKVKTNNPLFLLDEIDKMAMDFRGDPSSALLEVLDPEQNSVFNDHYLEVDFDLSNIMFIATANSTDTIPAPLLDRMELIRLPGYTENEKLEIAKKYLIPKQFKLNGLKNSELTIPTKTIKDIAGSATEIYDKTVNVYESFIQANQSIEKAKIKMDEAKQRLQDGPGSLTKKVEKMKKLGRLSTKKELPDNLDDDIN